MNSLGPVRHTSTMKCIKLATTSCQRRPKAAAAQGGAADDAGEEDEATPAFDARDMVEAVDLMERLKKTEFNAKMAEEKWSEKVLPYMYMYMYFHLLRRR